MIKQMEGAALIVLALFAPIQTAVLVALGLITADLVIGMIAAHKRGEKITSAALRRTLTKIFVYEGTLVLGFLTEKYMLSDAVPVAKLISGLIGAVELKSIMENMDSINGKSVFASLITQLGSKNDAAE